MLLQDVHCPADHQDPDDDGDRLPGHHHELCPRLDHRDVRSAERHRGIEGKVQVVHEGRIPARTDMLCADISGNRNAASAADPSARMAAPPRSRSQYHSANAITFVSQMTPPADGSVRACRVKGSVNKMPYTGRTVEPPLPIVIGAMGTEVRTRSRQRTPQGRPRPAREIISAAIVTTMRAKTFRLDARDLRL